MITVWEVENGVVKCPLLGNQWHLIHRQRSDNFLDCKWEIMDMFIVYYKCLTRLRSLKNAYRYSPSPQQLSCPRTQSINLNKGEKIVSSWSPSSKRPRCKNVQQMQVSVVSRTWARGSVDLSVGLGLYSWPSVRPARDSDQCSESAEYFMISEKKIMRSFTNN